MFIRRKKSSGYYSDSDSDSDINYGFLAFCSLFVWFCTYLILIVNNIGSEIFCNIVFSIIFCTLLLVNAYNRDILKENKKNNSYCYMNSMNSMN